MTTFEHLDKLLFEGVGKYNIPKISATNKLFSGEFIPANHAKRTSNPNKKIVHCFVDDYQIVRFWNTPLKYLPMLSKFQAVCSPDFSVYTDMPLAMQIYNHYRKHWVAAFWQANGITVYPTISWGNKNSFDWCFDGEPHNGIVTVSSIGTQGNSQSKALFLQGYYEMMYRLKPTAIFFHGDIPSGCYGNIIRVKTFYNEMNERIFKSKQEVR